MKIVIDYHKDEVHIYHFPMENDPDFQMKVYPINENKDINWEAIEKQLEDGEMPDELITTAPKELQDLLLKRKEDFNNLSFSEKVIAKTKDKASYKSASEFAQMMIMPNKVSGHDNLVALRTIIDCLRLDTSGKISIGDFITEGVGVTGVVVTIT